MLLALAPLFLASCHKDIELAGYAWTASVVSSGADGVYKPFSMAFVCNTDNSGVAFFSETYPDDPMPYGAAIKFSYNFDGDDGSIQFSDGSDITLPLHFERGSEVPSLVVDLSPMHDYYPNYAMEYTLNKSNYYSPSTVDGTQWYFSFNNGTADYFYSLDFGSDTALLHLDYVDSEGDTSVVTWTITEYAYADGIGRMKIRSDALNVYFNGYFYMSDEHHLNFFDSENLLPMSR